MLLCEGQHRAGEDPEESRLTRGEKMKVLLAAALTACALSGASVAAEEVTFFEQGTARLAFVAGTVHFSARREAASVDAVFTQLADRTREDIHVSVVCPTDDQGGNVFATYPNGHSSRDPWSVTGLGVFDQIERALCRMTALQESKS
jgi:hypothetical protein